MFAKLTATLFQFFVIYVLWVYADAVSNAFILRALALIVMVFQIVALVRVWIKQ